MHLASVLLFRAFNVKMYVFVEKQEKYLSVYSSYLGLCVRNGYLTKLNDKACIS